MKIQVRSSRRSRPLLPAMLVLTILLILSSALARSAVPIIEIKRGFNQVVISWVNGGTLQKSPAVTGPWSDLAGAVSPYSVPPTGASQFYRAKNNDGYSLDAVGYVNITVPALKYALLYNPLNQTTNSLAAVLPDVPTGTVVSIYENQTGFVPAIKRSALTWIGPFISAPYNGILKLGQGFFIQNPGSVDMTITFTGEVPQGVGLPVSIPSGFNLLGSAAPQAGKLETDLKLPAKTGDKVWIFSMASQSYRGSFTRRASGKWTGVVGVPEPELQVAEGFWYKATTVETWTRDFSVNP